MKIIVCGSHKHSRPNFIRQWLDKLHRIKPITMLIEGGANHVDAIAAAWAIGHAIEVRQFPAMWGRHGQMAGPIRNARMLEEKPDAVIAFPGGRGTANMVKQAREAGIPVTEVRYPEVDDAAIKPTN